MGRVACPQGKQIPLPVSGWTKHRKTAPKIFLESEQEDVSRRVGPFEILSGFGGFMSNFCNGTQQRKL